MALTAKMKRFCEEYTVDFNATQAAIRAGYSKASAHDIGCENLKKPNVKQEIDKRLQELSLSADETLKAISDIARTSLNDYFKKSTKLHIPKVKTHLSEIIKNVKQEIKDQDEFIKRANITNSDSLKEYNANKLSLQRRIIQYEIELERNPKAFRIIEGEAELIECVELDMIKLVADKAGGKIKSIKPSEYGLNVELYAADAALRDLARVHGLFEKDNKQLRPDLSFLEKLPITYK